MSIMFQNSVFPEHVQPAISRDTSQTSVPFTFLLARKNILIHKCASNIELLPVLIYGRKYFGLILR